MSLNTREDTVEIARILEAKANRAKGRDDLDEYNRVMALRAGLLGDLDLADLPQANLLSRTLQAALLGGGQLSLYLPMPGRAICRARLEWSGVDFVEGDLTLGVKSALDKLEIRLAEQEAAQAEEDLTQHLQSPNNP